MSLPDVETIVRETVDVLPAEFRQAIANVDIAVEDEPPPGQRLLGLYEGIPLTKRGGGYWLPSYSGTLPDRITIYRGPLERRYGADPAQFAEAVQHVVKHELAHHFGISDERLRVSSDVVRVAGTNTRCEHRAQGGAPSSAPAPARSRRTAVDRRSRSDSPASPRTSYSSGSSASCAGSAWVATSACTAPGSFGASPGRS